MRIKFTGLVVEGFGSFREPYVLDLTAKGIWVVKGRNGAGKTTLFSALCWALYKVNLKGVNNSQVATWKENRQTGFKGTRVVLTAETETHSYMIARHLKYKGTTKGLKAGDALMIFRAPIGTKITEAHLVGEEHYKKDMQQYINRLVGMDAKTFVNSVLFGQRMSRLVESDNNEKRKLFENLFELDFIQQAKTNADAKDGELLKEYQDQEKEWTAKDGEITSLDDKIKREEELKTNFENQKAQDIASAENVLRQKEGAIELLQEKVKEYEAYKEEPVEPEPGEAEEDLEEAKEELEKILEGVGIFEQSMSEYRVSIQGKTNKIKELEEQEIKEKCDTCGQPLKEEDIAHVKKTTKTEISTLKRTRTTLENKKKEVEGKLEAIKKDKEDQEAVVEELKAKVNSGSSDYENDKLKHEMYKNAKTNLTNGENAVATAKENLETIKNRKSPSIDIDGLKAELETAKGELKLIDEKKSEIEQARTRVQWWIKEGFSSKGIKAFVFNAMLSRLNSYVERYASRLGVHVHFSVDLEKASKPFITTCHKDGVQLNYAELSGGEKQRIDIALAFAMHDLVGDVSGTNLLVMDEVFEGLDDEGVEVVFDLIRVKAGDDKTVFIC